MLKNELSLESAVKTNPQVDFAKIQEALEIVAELRRQGMKFAGYRLVSPYQRPRPPKLKEPKKR